MERYEIAIKILDEKYVDTLIVALARQGYSPYYNEEGNEGEPVVCFTASDDEVSEIKK